MLTTKEAAGASPCPRSRVLELIKNGQLSREEALRASGSSTKIRSKGGCENVNKKGGRPKRARAKEVRFTLMNPDARGRRPCLRREKLEFTHIGDASDASLLPSRLADTSRTIALADFNAWWRNRGIPARGRPCQPPARGRRAFRRAAVPEPPACRCRTNTGFTPVRFWARLERRQLLRKRLPSRSMRRLRELCWCSIGSSRAHPDNTSDGNLEKRWVIRDGVRMLRSGASKFAGAVQRGRCHGGSSAGCSRKGVRALFARRRRSGSCLPVRELPLRRRGYVPALYVMRALPQSGSTPDFDHYLACCEARWALGAPGESSSG